MSRRHGFSLVELSIVLIIIGLLAGGVIGGQSLIQAQRLRKVIQDSKTYMLSLEQFHEKYGSYPGDMLEATRVFPTSAGNGNGDGIIDSPNGLNENWLAWQQLALSGFIVGNYTGAPESGGVYDTVPDINAPSGPIVNTAYLFDSCANCSADANGYYGGDYINALWFGAGVAGDKPQGPALTGEDAAHIDTKADDGLPGAGAIRTLSSNIACTTGTDHNTAEYQLKGDGDLACVLIFLHPHLSKQQ